MKNLSQKLRLFIKRILFSFPTRLPVGMTAFNNWANDIIETYEMPNNDTMRWALAGAILHLESTSKLEARIDPIPFFLSFKYTKVYSSSRKSKSYFGNYLRKMAANEVAAANLQEIKQRQQDLINKAQNAGEIINIEPNESALQ